MAPDKSHEKSSAELPADLANACRDEADRSYGGDLSALAAAVEQWARNALRVQGVAPINPLTTGSATRTIGPATGRRAATRPIEDDLDYDLIDPHMD